MISKHLNAVRFRIILSILMVISVTVIVGVFLVGYNYMQTVGETARERNAEATDSENTVNSLQNLKSELANQSETIERLDQLRTPNNLPQFDTEQNLRAIASKLGLGVKNVSFISGSSTEGSSTAGLSSGEASGSGATASSGSSAFWGGTRNSRISFEFSRNLSYDEMIRFLHAIETTTPKMRLDGVSIPSGSSRGSIDLGTLTLEIATS